jgi:hypothetical protein
LPVNQNVPHGMRAMAFDLARRIPNAQLSCNPQLAVAAFSATRTLQTPEPNPIGEVP